MEIDMRSVVLLAIFGAVAMAGISSAAQTPSSASGVPQPGPTVSALSSQSDIRFEDATEKSGIDFTHSFGSAKLGSLLEGTGAGCVWFDYNNSGRSSLYAAE